MVKFRSDFVKSTSSNPSEILFIPPSLHESRLDTASLMLSSHYPSGLSVLDMGCGYSHLYPKIKEHTSSYMAVDPDSSVLLAGAEMYKIKNYEVSEIGKFKTPKLYDIVFCLGVASFLEKGEENLKDFIEELCSLAKRAVILEFQNSERYKGMFTSFSVEEVSKACQRHFNTSTLIDHSTDTTFYIRIPLL